MAISARLRWLGAAGAVALALPMIAAATRPVPRPAPLDLPAFYPEGPAVIGDALYWAEMPRDRVQRYRAGTTQTAWQRPDCGPTAVRPTPQGDIWVLCHLANQVVLLDRDWHVKRVVDRDRAGNEIFRPNDGKVDAQGRLYLSSSGIFSVDAPATGYVVRVDPDGSAERIAGPLHYTNGIALSPDGRTMFVSEHLERRVWKMALAGGRVTKQAVFFDFNAAGLSRPDYREAGPDGQWLAPSGDLWVAEYGGGRVIHIGKDGTLKGTLKVPTQFVTNMVPSPVHQGMLAITGTYDNSEPTLRGRVIERAF